MLMPLDNIRLGGFHTVLNQVSLTESPEEVSSSGSESEDTTDLLLKYVVYKDLSKALASANPEFNELMPNHAEFASNSLAQILHRSEFGVTVDLKFIKPQRFCVRSMVLALALLFC